MATRTERVRYALWFLRQVAGFERSAQRELTALLRAEADAIARAFERDGTAGVGDAVDRSSRAARAALYEARIATGATLARSIATRLGDDPDAKARPKPSRFLRDLIAYAREAALVSATSLGRTSRATARDVIAKAEREGLGPAATARELRAKLAALAPWRAATIARTETHDAATHAADLAARGSERADELVKEWVATLDDRVRDSHADADGERVRLDEPFVVGGASLMRPGDPSAPPEETINCRCVALYESATPFGGL